MIDIINIIVAVTIIAFAYTWYQVFKWRKKSREREQETKLTVDKAFSDLRENITKQVEMFDGEPGLSEEERKIRDKLQEALSNSEKIIQEKIKETVKKEEN